MPSDRDLLRVVHDLRSRMPAATPLAAVAARAGWSPFHLHRAFRRFAGETPKQYTLRLRLARAASLLATTRRTIARIALDTGFTSHEVLGRAFRRRFGRSPAAYRRAAQALLPRALRERHAAVAEHAGPCLALHHLRLDSPRRSGVTMLSIERRERERQPIVFVRTRTPRADLAAAIGQGLGTVYASVQRSGAALAGPPLVRYVSAGPGLLTVEIGFPVAAGAAADGDVQLGELPSGPVAMAVHAGPYDQLSETYAAMEQWMEAHGAKPNGVPWESYVTDPADVPDPADWRTEIYWPVSR